MVKVSIVLCFLGIWAFSMVNCATQSNAPAPSADCSTIIFSMADCLTFVTNGSKITKPEGGCCSGLKTVLKTNAECLCEAFKSSGQLGVVLDMKKALSLPKACGVSAPAFSNCGLPGGAPGASPASSPKSSKSPPAPSSSIPPAAPEPSSGGSDNIVAPAPAPSHASSSASVSFIALIASLVVASSCSYLF